MEAEPGGAPERKKAESPREKSAKARAAAFLALQALALVLFGFIVPNDSPFFPRCVFYAMTGLYCPGCGTGRGILRILRGDVLGGIRQNWLLLVGIPLLALTDINAVLRLFGMSPIVDFDRLKRASFVMFALILAFWILRNIPLFPCTLLAPEAL